MADTTFAALNPTYKSVGGSTIDSNTGKPVSSTVPIPTTNTPAPVSSPVAANAPVPFGTNGTGFTPNGSPVTSVSPSASGGADPGLTTAQQDVTPMSFDQVAAYFAGASAQTLAGISEQANVAEQEANRQSQIETENSGLALNAAGMAGSSAAAGTASTIEGDRATAINAAEAAKTTAIGNLQQWAATSTESAYQNEQNVSAAYIKQKQAQAQQALSGLAASGVTLDSLSSSNPAEYSTLLQAYGGDPNSLKAAWISSAASMLPQSIGDPAKAGSYLVYTFKDPSTGKISVQTIDTGVALNDDYSQVNVPGVGVVVVNKATGDTHLVGGTSNPLYMANQEATLQSKEQTINTKNALIATRLVGSQISKDASIQNFMAVQPIMSRIQSASGEIQKSGINEANAGALLDDITKLNTQGQAITAGQIDLTNSSLSLMDQAQVLKQKISGSGGVIDPKVAQDIVKLANDNYALYEKAYQDHVSVYQNRLKNVNGQDLSSYSPLTDISNLPSVVDGSYAEGLQQSIGTGTTDTGASAAQVGSVVQDATGLSDGTTGTDDSGNPMVVQGGEWVSQ